MINLSQEQVALQEKAYEFAKEHLQSNEAKWETEGTFPYDTFKLAIKEGFVGMGIPKELGGQGMSLLETCLVYESLARGSFPFTFSLGVHNVVSYGVYLANAEENIIREIATGEKMIAIALTEPGAGSDPASMSTTATLKDDGYVINGTKNWVTNGHESEYIATVVKDSENPYKTLMLLVKNSDKGMKLVDSPKKSGANYISTSTIEFKNCLIPKERLISEEGLKGALTTITYARLFVAAHSLGLTQQALDEAVRYLGNRPQFGQPLIKNQGIQWTLAELYSKLEAARWLTYHAASLADQNKVSNSKIAMAKLLATELAMKATTESSQLFGSYGILQSYPMERYMKYAKISQIIDGTSQIMKLVIGKDIEKRALRDH